LANEDWYNFCTRSPALAAEGIEADLGQRPGSFLFSNEGVDRIVTCAAPANTVLTVEDDPIVRADLRLVLEEAGFDVCEDARDGVEEIELSRKHRPDLVLVDLGLPRVDGVEAIRQIRSDRDVPIVALTGHGKGDAVERALEAGANAFVLKPFHVAQLVATVSRTLEEAESAKRHHLGMIESMQREGATERTIADSLREENA
jgi:DNA-binding response OmpR family regulator